MPPGDPSREHGVIHDIGYRHYDGERLGRASVRRSLFVDSVRGAYGLGRAGRTKVVPFLLLAAVTPRRGLGVAAIIAVLVVLAGVQGVAQAIATEEGAPDAAGWAGLLSPFTLVDGVARRLLGAQSVLAEGPPGTAGAVVFALVTVLLVLGCFGLLVLRYRRVSIA